MKQEKNKDKEEIKKQDKSDVSKEDQERVKERLRALGYLD